LFFFCITPYVAARPDRPTFVPDPVEVAEVLEVPLLILLDPAMRREEEWMLHGITARVPFLCSSLFFDHCCTTPAP